jgi:hypothetical protein
MNDDWRLRITLRDHDHADRLAGSLAATEIEHDVAASLNDRVIVSRDGAEALSYAGTRDQIDRAEKLIASIAAEHGWDPVFELRRWHPDSEEWEDPDEPLPTSAGERAAERTELMESEREESEAQGYPEYEERVQCRSHAGATALADRLAAEGLPHVRRWRYVVIGATDEDSAKALAERLRSEAPEGSEVTVEGSVGATLENKPANPYALFGGLGG